ncbi:MAG: M81 family metallopeptidase [Spirochaetales bacterium]|nr:M81 family metallopeptidase [Spirochaetales bacterium]
MRKIIVAGLHHESNTFNPIITGINDFSILRGNEIIDSLNAQDSISGIIRTFRENGNYEVVPLLMARAVPNGVIEKELYNNLKKELLELMMVFKEQNEVAAVTLSLHGSMRIQEIGEAEGDFLESVRKIFPDIPIVASLDMHAAVTERMLKNCNAFVGYKQAPHTDCFETGAHAARLTMRTLETGCRLKTGFCRVPVLIAGEQSETSVEPMFSMIEALREMEKRDKVLAASFLLGFPWADSSENSVCALTVTEDAGNLASETARELGTLFWENRKEFKFHTLTREPGEALKMALGSKGRPIYLSDSGDNPTAGSSGDCTNFLKMILTEPEAVNLDPPLLYAGIYDPSAVEASINKINEDIELEIGASFDKKTSTPLCLKGYVKSVFRAYGHFRTDIVLFHTGGIDLILTGKHIGFTETEMFDALNVDYRVRKIIVVKLGYLTASHKKAASSSIMALTDGSSNEKLAGLPYKLIDRPIFPLDPEMEMEFTSE